MRYTSMVMLAAMRTSLRMRSVVAISVGVALICAAGVAAIFATQFIGPGLEAATPERAAVESFFGLVLYTTSIISIGILASVNAFQSLVREKSRGNIQALLATPLGPRDVWLGKSLAAFLPGFVFAVVMTLAAFLALNVIYFVPRTGFFPAFLPLVSNLVVVPLVYLAMTLLVHEIGLSGKPATANVITQVFLPVMIALVINLSVRGVLDAGSWVFTAVLLGLAVVIGAFVLVLRRTLTAEKIILSQ